MFDLRISIQLPNYCSAYLLTYLTNWLTDFSLPQHILRGAPTSCASTPVVHANRWRGFLDLVLPTDTRSSSSTRSDFPRSPHQISISFSIWTTWSSQRSRWILIRRTTSMSLRSSYSSLLNWMRKSSPNRPWPKILRRIFLSNTLKTAASVLNRVHAYKFCRTKKVSVSQLHIETVVTSVSKNDLCLISRLIKFLVVMAKKM